MGNFIELAKQGEVNLNNRKFTRLVGGFGKDKPIISDLQIGELLGYSKGARQVRVQVEANRSSFEDCDIINVKDSVQVSDATSEMLKSIGYSRQSIDLSKNIYLFSQSGFLLYLKFAEGDKAVELYKSFIEDYFKAKVENKVLKQTIQEEIDFLKEKKVVSLGKSIMETDEGKRMEYIKETEEYSEQIAKLQSRLDNERIIKALEEQSKLTESKKVYVNQTDFGASFNLKIGSKTVGKLLKIVGLAMKSSKATKPYEKYCPKYAQTFVNQDLGIATYLWNYNECIVFIDKWLEDNNLYEKFYGITNKDIMMKFINALYELYIKN